MKITFGGVVFVVFILAVVAALRWLDVNGFFGVPTITVP